MMTASDEIQVEAIPQRFPRFDVVVDDSDHQYLSNVKFRKGRGGGGGDCFTNASSAVHKKIMKEWKILEQNLPDSIYVRAYERRIDLLRAVIIGSPGTPYYGGLFFFDLAFPSDYPNRPPQVVYKSFGLRLNPNLYANGYVCLSLLNTWYGRKKEKWNPSESTILQVLVSIQGLVLNEKPYFNEPGAGAFPGRGKRSNEYNENVFIFSCQTMLQLLKKPPGNFEDFVAWHFRNNARDILTTCNAYITGGVRVGYSCADIESSSSSTSASSSLNVSSNFKRVMKSWYPHLVVAFGKTGASVGDFVQPSWGKMETIWSMQPVINKRSNTASETVSSKSLKNKRYGVKKLIGKIKKILGLKNGAKKENAKMILVQAS